MGGSAPKYTGKNVINPIAAIGAVAMLLQNTGHKKAGDRVEAAIKKTTPRMQSQSAGKMGMGTKEVGDLVCEML
jgi:3-isopropylmalate dehydrogenase